MKTKLKKRNPVAKEMLDGSLHARRYRSNVQRAAKRKHLDRVVRKEIQEDLMEYS